MDAPSQADIKAWLSRNRGTTTQESLAEDIRKVTGWRITRDRYSRYEGSLTIGKKTLKHFVDYWKSKGVEGPTAAPIEEATPGPTLASALSDLAKELYANRLERAELVREVADLKAVVQRLVERGNPTNPGLGVPRETTG